jgi:uncharacterized repeat protein (TIGR01451 family)
MITRTLKGLRMALVAVAALGSWMGANAQTTAGTPINNRATVNYSVGGLGQAPIESSPTGNTTPGVGNGINTSFLVDNMIDFSISEVGGAATVVTPGMIGQVLEFTVANAGNSPEGFQLTVSEETGTTLAFGGTDNADFGLVNLGVRVDDGDGSYDAGDVATAIDTLNPGQSITVFVLATPMVPLAQINGNFVNVNLQARAAQPGTAGATLEIESPAGNLPNVVEILFADAGNDATEDDSDQFAVVTAGLRITKTETILDDVFSSAIPRALPGSNVEYLITIQNTSTTTAAQGVALSDPIPANTSLRVNQYGPTADVAITGGVAGTCNVDALDGDGDGCGINVSGALTVSSAVIGNVAALATVTLRFQVTIL